MSNILDLDKMSRDDMIVLIEQLQFRIEEKDDSQLQDWQWNILEKRREDYLANPEKAKPWEEFRRELKDR